MSLTESIKNFWVFLKKDTWQSWLVSLLLIVILIKFIFFPIVSFITGTSLPLVVVESCSMYHESNFDNWWSQNAQWYESRNITKSEFSNFKMMNGLNKGDIILVIKETIPKIGDIIIFQPNTDSTTQHPIIHRIVGLNPVQTKGDHNTQQITQNNNQQHLDETNIPKDRIIGKSVLKIPILGWIKLIFFEPFKDPSQRGFCN
ncbi:MAG: S26 family signal peptidase [Nanoarchaeota archaeon]|nr:S26 family signal peptidase [Nanoarchaeota archaeon]